MDVFFIVFLTIIITGCFFTYMFFSREEVQTKKYEILEQKLKECQEQVVEVNPMNKIQNMKSFILESNPSTYEAEAEYLATIFKNTGQANNIEPSVLMAFAYVESTFNYKANSGPAKGLMQINPSVWDKELRKQQIIKNPRDYYNPRVSVEAAAFIINQNSKKCEEGGFKSINECIMRKYFGITEGSTKSKDYYNKMKSVLGTYYLSFN